MILSTQDTELYKKRVQVSQSKAFLIFIKHPNSVLLLIASITCLSLRANSGMFSSRDIAIVVIACALQPFAEWLIHVLILHFKPKRLGAFTIDPLVAKMHRAHHMDPKNMKLVFVPFSVMVPLAGALVGLPFTILPTPQALTLASTQVLIVFYYEWIHFLIHSSYKPKHFIYKSIWRSHRLHHYRNERYWFGVVTNVADHLLGTFPKGKKSVELSATAKSIVGTES
ncbi:MAG: sterol desaturase family protein [Acidimicrobiales bacterium]|nr:sterol desaturase family protein [Acidimicrobiales bacterium]